jgi:NAD(P)-dependent dehydrogenase (short-subunit alcohol dehydrogenase family)
MSSLKGKTALVAGASRGIGLAIAQHMATAGACTILAARSLEALKERVRELTSDGYNARAVEMDISSRESVAATADALEPVDILVNVAGMNIRKRFEEFTREEYDRLLETNLHGIVRLTQKIGAQMIARGKGGKVINIGSMMSLSGLPYLAVYAISKGGLAQLTKVLAAEWGRYNIQVNCIAPGFIVTDLNRDMWKQEKMVAWLRANQANPNLGTPDDVAPLAVFLASRGSDYITGQIIAVDGGYSTTSVWPFEV